MKKALIFTIILLMASGITVKAQTEKGRSFISGSNRLELNIGGQKEKSGSDVIEGSEVTYFDFDFQHRMGYTVIDNLVVGLFMNVDFYSYKSKETGGFSDKGTTFVIGPFARYYIHVCDKLIPFAEAQIGFGIDNYKYRYSSTADWSKTNEGVFTYRIGGGATYFFNEFVGADLFLGFLHEAYKNKEVAERSSDAKYIYNEVILQLGVVVMLDK